MVDRTGKRTHNTPICHNIVDFARYVGVHIGVFRDLFSVLHTLLSPPSSSIHTQ
jgi:hypothetical protein